MKLRRISLKIIKFLVLFKKIKDKVDRNDKDNLKFESEMQLENKNIEEDLR